MAFATQPVVLEEDFYGNIVTTDSTHTITVSRRRRHRSRKAGSFTATLVNGVATFSGLSYNKAETIDLVFTDNAAGVPNATSSSIVVSPNMATKLVVLTQPAATAIAGVLFTTQPVVAEEDAYDNVITSDNTSTVTVSRARREPRLCKASPR